MDAPANLQELVSEFAGITGASPLVSDHYLSACNYDLNRAVEFYFEHPPAPTQTGARASNSVQEEAGDLGAFAEDADLPGGRYGESGAGAARQDAVDEDEELQRALAESMADAGPGPRQGGGAARPTGRPPARDNEGVHVVDDDEEDMPGADELLEAMARQREAARAADRDARARMEEMMNRMMGGLHRGPGFAGLLPRGIDPISGLPTMFPTMGIPPAVAPPQGYPHLPGVGPGARPGRGVGEAGGSRAVEGGTRARDGSGGGASAAGQAQRRRIEVRQGGGEGTGGTGTAGGRAEGGWDDDELELPEGMSRQDLEEARMMEAALLGVPYEGRLQDFRRGGAAAAPDAEVAPEVLEHRELRWDQDRAYEESLAADRAKEQAAARAKAEAEARERAQREAEAAAERAAAEEAARLESLVANKAARLPAEPPTSASDAINVMVRLPDGSRHSRRFRRTDHLSSLFDFVDVELDSAAKAATASASGGEGAAAAQPSVKPGSYNLVTQFPRRVFSEDETGASTFEEAGLVGGGGAAFFVEQKGG